MTQEQFIYLGIGISVVIIICLLLFFIICLVKRNKSQKQKLDYTKKQLQSKVVEVVKTQNTLQETEENLHKTENNLVQTTQAFQHAQQQNQIIQTQLYNNQVQLNQVSQQLTTEQVEHKNTVIKLNLIKKQFQDVSQQYTNYVEEIEEKKEIEAEKAKRRRVKASDKIDVFERDNYTCQICGISKQFVDSFCPGLGDYLLLEVDHIQSISQGGTGSDIDNLQCLCWRCNRKKGGKKTDEEVKEKIDYGIKFLKPQKPVIKLKPKNNIPPRPDII